MGREVCSKRSQKTKEIVKLIVGGALILALLAQNYFPPKTYFKKLTPAEAYCQPAINSRSAK
jgi:hypothetical protein